MAINGEFDLAANPGSARAAEIRSPRSRSPTGARGHQPRSGCSTTARSRSGATPTRSGSSSRDSTTRTIARIQSAAAEGQARFQKDPEFQITTKGADHPFHIHVNPCWVMRIEVPDEQGRLHNMLDAPRWMDTVAIPRGGRVVFRSRFADYVGHVGQSLPHPHARGSRDDAGGVGGRARRGRQRPPARPRRVARRCRPRR